MASDNESISAKKQKEEELIHELLLKSLERSKEDIQTLNKSIDKNQDSPRSLAFLVNSRHKVYQQVFYSIALMRDPKLKLSPERAASDLARAIKATLLEDNPAAKKLITEKADENSEPKDSSSDSPSSAEKSKHGQ